LSFARILGIGTLLGLLALLVFVILKRSRIRVDHRITVSLLLVLIMGNSLALYPLPLPVVDPAPKSVSSTGSVQSPVLFVHDVASRGASFDEMDCFLGWANLAEQEFCSWSLCPPEDLSVDKLEEVSLLVVSRSASKHLVDAELVLGWIRDGGVMIVDRPVSGMDLTGLSTGEVRIPENVTWAWAPAASGYGILTGMPLRTECVNAENVSDDVSVFMEMDGRPVVLGREYGEGAVISFLFDLGRQLVALQQGVPDRGFKVRDRRGAESVIDSTDLLLDDSLIENDVPFADVLERWVVALVESFRPMPRVWYFPELYDGIASMTHDEDWFGDESCFICCFENESNYSSTMFVIPQGPVTADGLDSMHEMGSDIQIHWNRETSRWMLFFLKGDGSLESQIETLEDKHGGEVEICRIERLRWGGHYTEPFRIMEAQGIVLDSTLGSAGHTGRGYSFGTGLPFRPLDTNGAPFRLLEVPFQIQARYSGADSSYLELLLNQSRDVYHEAITILYHPVDLVEGQPSRADWMEFHRIADKYNHVKMTLSELHEWWELRSTCGLDGFEWSDSTMRFTVHSPSPDISIMIPDSFRGNLVREVDLDGIGVETDRVSLVGVDYLLLGIPLGEHEVTVSYGPP